MTACVACQSVIAPEHEAAPWCVCGDLDADHADHADQSCVLCACPDFAWDGRWACPACLEVLDERPDERPNAGRPTGTRDAA